MKLKLENAPDNNKKIDELRVIEYGFREGIVSRFEKDFSRDNVWRKVFTDRQIPHREKIEEKTLKIMGEGGIMDIIEKLKVNKVKGNINKWEYDFSIDNISKKYTLKEY